MDCHERGGAVAGLPDDPLLEILSRVPVKALCRSKCVSKAWRDFIADTLHRRKLPQTLEGFFCSKIRGGDAAAAAADDGGGGGDGDGSSSSNEHFIDLIGRSVSLVDPSFSFLKELPGMEHVRMLHSCNGLLLFRRDAVGRDTLGYVVCNPATEEWVAVPSSGWHVDPPRESDEEDSDSDMEIGEHTCLIFDPAVSSHFNIVQFFKIADFLYDDSIQNEVGLRTYSSETGVWTDRSGEWRRLEEGQYQQSVRSGLGSAFVNGMLHLFVIVCGIQGEQLLIMAVDCEGKKHRVISWPNCEGEKHSVISWLPQTSHSFRSSRPAYIGQSQGRLHCINEDIEENSTHITIWVLEDYDKEEWVMKHSVSTLQLFGRNAWLAWSDYSVVTIHPDCNLVYIIQRDRRLISYNMDSKEVHALCALGHGYKVITPYVPYFSESPVLQISLQSVTW